MATSGAGYVLVGVDVDVVRFERLVAEGRALLADGDAAGGGAVAAPGARPAAGANRWPSSPRSSFAVGERARLDELGCLAVEARIEADLAAGPPRRGGRRAGGPVPGASAAGRRCGRCG